MSRIEERTVAAVVAITCLVLATVPPGSPDLFAVLTLIGLLLVRALAGPYLATAVNARVDVFVFAGLLVFVGFVIDRVFEVVSR